MLKLTPYLEGSNTLFEKDTTKVYEFNDINKYNCVCMMQVWMNK